MPAASPSDYKSRGLTTPASKRILATCKQADTFDSWLGEHAAATVDHLGIHRGIDGARQRAPAGLGAVGNGYANSAAGHTHVGTCRDIFRWSGVHHRPNQRSQRG